MDTWQITQKPAYLSDFVELNKNLQQAVVKALQELEQDPITPRGNTIKPLKGFTNVYRYRLGDFRMIYAAAPQARMINLLAIGPRGSVYERFNFPGWDGPDTAVEFGPELARPDWMDHPEWFQPPAETKEKLPRKLTPSLLDKWRVDPVYHDVLMRCMYSDDLLNLSETQVPAAVLGRVMDGLFPASVDRIAAQPDQVLFDPEDLTRYAEGSLSSFLLKLDDQQLQLTNWALSGPTLVKGGPGSGKSTVALYRLRAVVEHALAAAGTVPDVLFTTYTNALINSSQSLAQQLLRDVLQLEARDALPRQIRITTLHKTASWIAQSSGERFEMAGPRDLAEAVHAARAGLQPKSLGDAYKIPLATAVSGLSDAYLLEEVSWVIEGQNCQSLDDYLAADRTGRGLRFNKVTRTAVWELYSAFREHLLARGLYSWGHLIQVALRQVQTGAFATRWDYVLIDEAQDLPPAALALAVELCKTPQGVFLAADANQSLYNRGFSWTNVHAQLNIQGRTRILRRNYRSTRQIALAARDIMQGVASADSEAIEQEYLHSGPPPAVYAAAGSADQARWIGQFIYAAAKRLRLPLNAAVVLVPSNTVGRPLADTLSEQGLPATFMSSSQFDIEAPGIKVTTLHAAKGLEFPIVVVAHVEAGRLPRETAVVGADELITHDQEQRRLFFVGCTRAMRCLAVTYDRQIPSPFLASLSSDGWQLEEAG